MPRTLCQFQSRAPYVQTPNRRAHYRRPTLPTGSQCSRRASSVRLWGHMRARCRRRRCLHCALTAVLLGVLFVGRGRAARIIALYWTTVAIARTAGTAIGDWIRSSRKRAPSNPPTFPPGSQSLARAMNCSGSRKLSITCSPASNNPLARDAALAPSPHSLA
jgi:hypothetical protein